MKRIIGRLAVRLTVWALRIGPKLMQWADLPGPADSGGVRPPRRVLPDFDQESRDLHPNILVEVRSGRDIVRTIIPEDVGQLMLEADHRGIACHFVDAAEHSITGWVEDRVASERLQ